MLTTVSPIPFSSHAPDDALRILAPAARPHAAPDLFENSVLPQWIYDAETLRFVAVNDAVVRRYGWSREEFLAMSAERVRPASCVPAFRALHARAESGAFTGLNSEPGWLHLTKSGEALPVQTAWQMIEFRGRRAVHVTIMDRSEQERAEQENRELASVLNLASDTIIVCDLEREILFWNLGAAKTYGWSAEEVLGRKVDEVFKIEPDLVFKAMSGLLEMGEWNSQMKHARKDGAVAFINTRWTLARDEDTGRPKSVLLIGSDVTETKKLESQFLRSQRLDSLGTLASGIAHDLNNILSPILMAAGILRQSKLSAEDDRMLAIIEGSAERGAGIVKQVITFARGAEGERVPLQAKHIVNEMVKVMVQTFPKNLDIRSSIPKELWMVTGDATQLHQVLLNLCVNARDAMEGKSGTLRVVCENLNVDEQLAAMNPGAQLGPHVCFSVGDTGSGMTPEVMEKIFDPFFTTKEQGKGTGLGLATVIGIVKGHKGFITLQSEVGTGTTFRVFIPADVEAQVEVRTASDPAALRGHDEMLLVVDDEAAVREAVVGTLQANGYQCYTAEDGTDALALYLERRESIAAVVTDLHMASMDGIGLTRSLKKYAPDVKVIVSSGHVNDEKRMILEGLGVCGILEKPYTAEKLLRMMKAVLYPRSV